MKSLLIIVTALACLMVSCNDKSPEVAKTDTEATSTAASKTDQLEKNKEAALATQQAINNHDAAGVIKYAAPDMVDYFDGSMPPAKGLDSAKVFLEVFFKAFPDIKGENFMAIAEGNHVAVFGDWTGTFKGEMMGIEPTGKSFKVKDVDLFTFNDEGKITEHRSVQSSQTMMSQVGAKMKK